MATSEGPSAWEEFNQQVQKEIEQARAALREVSTMFDQSQTELTKVTQRSANITAQLQQVRSQIENLSKADIQSAYSAALDAQQRMLVMRGQLEKLQNEKATWQRHVGFLEETQRFLATENQPNKKSGTSALEMLVNAQESERLRLSRQMHDGPAQALSNFIVQAEIAAHVFELNPAQAKEELNNLKSSAMSTFQKVRMFISELRPMMLDDLGLVPTLRRYVDSFKEQMSIEIGLNVKGSERRMEPYVEVMLFRALQELVGNAYRHNQEMPTKLQVNVQLGIEEKMVKVVVSDNGKGFDPQAAAEMGGLGLKIIRDRVEMMGGNMDIDAAVGQGSRITFQIPVDTRSETDSRSQLG